jgi:hypothetical protein
MKESGSYFLNVSQILKHSLLILFCCIKSIKVSEKNINNHTFLSQRQQWSPSWFLQGLSYALRMGWPLRLIQMWKISRSGDTSSRELFFLNSIPINHCIHQSLIPSPWENTMHKIFSYQLYFNACSFSFLGNFLWICHFLLFFF